MRHAYSFDEGVTAYTNWVVRWRWPIVLATILAVAIAASGARFLWFSADYRDYISEDNPHRIALEALHSTYTKNESILFVLAPKSGEVFTAEALDAVLFVTREAWRIPYAIRVDSVTNFQHTRADGDSIVVADLVTDAKQLSAAALAEVKQAAMQESLLLNRLIAPESHVTGINVTLQLPGDSVDEVPQAVAYARRIVSDLRETHPDVAVYLSGLIILNHAFPEAGMQDMQTIVPLMYLAMVVIMIVGLRSISGTVAAFMIIGMSSAFALGLTG
ncbi:hypothetical protein C2W62_20560 [Candidatus Entotheonella serta]|nr:hypothetical protein C2W62_20560 [Candidatus Entotheonella serta]